MRPAPCPAPQPRSPRGAGPRARVLAATLILAATSSTAETYAADVWADNWFALSVDGRPVAEDRVPITTERSFNKESFTFEASPPFVLALTARDFKQDDSGLEYIGTRRQQMGDGGVILQIRNAAGHTVAVSNRDWRCQVVHHAPVEASCARERTPVAGQGACAFDAAPAPRGWTTRDFDDSSWPAASEHRASKVRPKDGYDQVRWDRSARFIWGPDLERDNTILCRLTVE